MTRPTGSGQFAGGGVLFALSLILGIIAILMETSIYGVFDQDKAVLKASLWQLSGWAFAVSFLLFATGWIIQAISFLPGREEPLGEPAADPVDGTESLSTRPHLQYEAQRAAKDRKVKDREVWIITGIVCVVFLFGLAIAAMIPAK